MTDQPEPTMPLPRYLLPSDALEYGSSLGNAHCWLTSRASGSIQALFAVDVARDVVGTVCVRYVGAMHPLLYTAESAIPSQGDMGAQLPHDEPATTELHPAYMRRTFVLQDSVQVRETVFVPLKGEDDPAVACYAVALRNEGEAARTLHLTAYCRLGGTIDPNITARYEPALQALVAADRRSPDCVRLFGCTIPPDGHEVGHDFGRVYDQLHSGSLTGNTDAMGDVMGGLQLEITLRQGEQRDLAFLVAFSHEGEARATAIYRECLDVATLLERTIAAIGHVTGCAEVISPDPTINDGALWAKVNMLRVMSRYPQGLAFTNDPSRSSNVVARDAAWFVYGNDHLAPSFSRALIDAFAQRQYPLGKIPEYYNAVDGSIEDYGLNINDDTPLFILAVNHHYRATGDRNWLASVYPAVARAADYIVSQRDERGLVFCTARDPRGSMWAICGWRNVIPDYSLNGAVTEINAECVAALRAAGHLARNLDHLEEGARFFAASADLRTRMDQHLVNPSNGLYYLNIDIDGLAHTEVTGDQIFPVLFRACSDEMAFRIIRRLNYPDFRTSAGLRTVSVDDPRYDPVYGLGLLGGVWPGLSWWYAFAAARYHPEIMVSALAASFAHYADDPRRYNTVPGQFSEWFDGENLSNHGMRLSPWEPPRFLWAAIEGVCGVMLQPGAPRIQPLVPASWRWLGLRRLPYHGGEISFFAARLDPPAEGGPLHVYATTQVECEGPSDVFAEDATPCVRVHNRRIAHIALRRPDRIMVLLGNTGDGSAIAELEFEGLFAPDTRYAIAIFDSEDASWHAVSQAATVTSFVSCTVTVEGHGFRILSFISNGA